MRKTSNTKRKAAINLTFNRCFSCLYVTKKIPYKRIRHGRRFSDDGRRSKDWSTCDETFDTLQYTGLLIEKWMTFH